MHTVGFALVVLGLMAATLGLSVILVIDILKTDTEG